MVVATWYAAIRLPGDARVPLHAGSPEYSVWLSKRTGLAAWLAAGAVVFTALAWLTLSQAAANWAASMRVTLLPAVMCVALAAEVAAIILARRAALAENGSRGTIFPSVTWGYFGQIGRESGHNRWEDARGRVGSRQPSCSARATMMPAGPRTQQSR